MKDFSLEENGICEIEDSVFLDENSVRSFLAEEDAKRFGKRSSLPSRRRTKRFFANRKFCFEIPVVTNCWKLQKVFPEKDDEVVFDDDENDDGTFCV